MLNTPTSVDSLPRLRRFTSSQSQISSFTYLGHDDSAGESNNQEDKDDKEKDKDETDAKTSAGTHQLSAKEATKEKEEEKQEERKETEQAPSGGKVKQTRSSEVLCQPVSDIQAPTGSRATRDSQDRRDLVEVPLSGLKAAGGSQETTGEGETGGDAYGEDGKLCCGFFFKVGHSCRITQIKILIVMIAFFSLIYSLLEMIYVRNQM